MKVFQCQQCGQLLYFENTRCERCQRSLGYLPEHLALSALEPLPSGNWSALADASQTYRYCSNSGRGGCNWMIPSDATHSYCLACRLNDTVPDLSLPVQLMRWQRLEAVKRRLIYSLLRLGLPVVNKHDDPDGGLAFKFLADVSGGAIPENRVVTGHLNGLITIDTAEADPAEREKRRMDLAEKFRTLPGHLRHEVGHYYWQRLFQTEEQFSAFRACFGDEREDYGEALQRHYANGPAPDWQQRFVSRYAGAHPWEDWAETWAHYLHIVDTTETASAFGLAATSLSGRSEEGAPQHVDPYDDSTTFDSLIHAWLPMTYAVNSLNRSMGHPDLYPFVLSTTAMEKLRFVHRWIRDRRTG